MYVDGLVAGVAAKLAAPLPDGSPDFVYWSRLFSALAGTFAVYLFYLVARRLFEPVTATIAMVAIAVMPLLVQDSHYARPEGFVLVLTGAVYLFLLQFDDRRDRLRYLAYTGFCLGLLIACKISMIPMALLPVLFLARLKDRPLLMRAAGICAGSILAGAFVGVPDAFFHPAAYWHGVQYLRRQYSSGPAPFSTIDSTNSIRLTATYFWQTTGLLLLFSSAGAFVLARKRQFALLAAVGGPLAFYIVYFGQQRAFFERNLSHVAPLMAMLAGVSIAAASERISGKVRIAAIVALVALATATSIWVSGKLVFIAMRADPEHRAANYQRHLVMTLRHRVDFFCAMVSENQVKAMGLLDKDPKVDYLFRVEDYHDSFTKKYMEELKRQTKWTEVGYFPSVFEGYDVSTLVSFHALSYRYLFLRGPHTP
jgi:4-amino-4-deoxy-L-arabinose transferase-like glycosyltransferase